MTNLKLASEAKCTVVVVGDSKTGKTALIQSFVSKTFQQNYTPTSFGKSFATREVNKHEVHFNFWDTSGSNAYDSVRPLSYQDADVFLVCYKISDPISLYNVKDKWMRELERNRRFEFSPPVILCGCQADLRTDPDTVAHLAKIGRRPITPEQALAICCEIGAVNYVETSAKCPEKTNNNSEAFEVCALAAIKNNNNMSGDSTSKSTSPVVFDRGLGTFKRNISVNSSLKSLFTETVPTSVAGYDTTASAVPFKRSVSAHSNLSKMITTNIFRGKSVNNNRGFPVRRNQNAAPSSLSHLGCPPPPAPPSLQSPSYSECDARLSVFSPEPFFGGYNNRYSCFVSPTADLNRIPPVISENEAYDHHDSVPTDSGVGGVLSFRTFSSASDTPLKRGGSYSQSIVSGDDSTNEEGGGRSKTLVSNRMRPQSFTDVYDSKSEDTRRPRRPTTLFKTCGGGGGTFAAMGINSTSSYVTPTGDSRKRFLLHKQRPFDSMSELGTPTPSSSSSHASVRSPFLSSGSETSSPAAQVRPNFISRRTSYRTYQKVPIPVPAPMSPLEVNNTAWGVQDVNGGLHQFLGPKMRYPTLPEDECISVNDQTMTSSNDSNRLFSRLLSPTSGFEPKTYESLKSQASISSHGSTGSSSCKMTTVDSSSGASDVSSLKEHNLRERFGYRNFFAGSDQGSDVLDTENPELIKNLCFLSPKTGVYRPIPEGRRLRQNCAVM